MKLALILLLSTAAHAADPVYNYASGEWELSNSTDISYDAVDGEFTYGDPSEYRVNPTTGEWSYESPDAELEYNYMSGEFEYVK